MVLPAGLVSPNPLALQSIKQVATLDFVRAWPAHDAGHGVSKKDYATWAEALQEGS